MSQAYCTRCGAALSDGSAFCTACGAPVAGAAAPVPPQPAAPSAPPSYAPPPAAGPPAYAPPAPASGWGWQRWLLVALGVIVLLVGLRQLGLIPRFGSAPADDPRSRALVGTWAGSGNNCRAAMTFNADGTYRVHTGAVARWRMDGDRLVLSGDGAGQSWRLIEWTANSLTFLLGDPGMRYTMVRCPGAGTAASSSGSGMGALPNGGSAAAPAGLEGRWAVEFVADGIRYSGEFVGANGSGPLTLGYEAQSGPMRIVEQCIYAGASPVTVRCRDPQILSGRETYTADNFDLTLAGPDSMRGRFFSANGDSGPATFTRR